MQKYLHQKSKNHKYSLRRKTPWVVKLSFFVVFYCSFPLGCHEATLSMKLILRLVIVLLSTLADQLVVVPLSNQVWLFPETTLMFPKRPSTASWLHRFQAWQRQRPVNRLRITMGKLGSTRILTSSCCSSDKKNFFVICFLVSEYFAQRLSVENWFPIKNVNP